MRKRHGTRYIFKLRPYIEIKLFTMKSNVYSNLQQWCVENDGGKIGCGRKTAALLPFERQIMISNVQLVFVMIF